MQTLGRTAALTLSAVLLAAVPVAGLTSAQAAAPTAAPAAARSWDTIGTFQGGRHQACKVLVDGTRWKVFNRFVNRGRAPLGASMTVLEEDRRTRRTWTSGLVARGATSGVGSVTLPRGNPRWTLEASQFGENAGTGGTVKIGKIGRC